MSTAGTADPSATLMVFFIFGCMGFAAVQFGVPTIWVLNAMSFIMMGVVVFFGLQAIRRARRVNQ